MARRRSLRRRVDRGVGGGRSLLLGKLRLRPIEPLELRNAPSESLGLLFSFPLVEMLSQPAPITVGDWQAPPAAAADPTGMRFISAPESKRASVGVDFVARDGAAMFEADDVAPSVRELPPPSKVLDRVFGGLESDAHAPRGVRGGVAGGLTEFAFSAQAAFLAYPSATAYQPTATGNGGGVSAAPAAFQAGDAVTPNTPLQEVQDAPAIAPEVNWEEVAIAFAGKQGTSGLVEGEADMAAALADLSREIADRAASIGFGEAKQEIIGENPTVDLPIGGEAQSAFGGGEAMMISSGSGSGCGQSSGANQAPIANDDAFYAISPLGPNVVSAPGVLVNDIEPNGTAMTAHLYTNASYGTVTLNQNGGFTYTPNGQPAGADGFFYRAFDGSLYSCPAYVALKLPNVDVDTDSNNNGPIEGTPAEDNIEMATPGKVIGLNKDDDNANGVADYLDTTTAAPDTDLARSVYTITSNSLPLTGFTFQWVVTGPLKIWASQSKAVMPMTFAWGDPQSAANEFWVEGTGLGTGTVELKMFRPNGALHHSDIVRFTVIEVDLDIGDGQNNAGAPGFVSELKEESRGAFSVSNINDTDGDGRVDNNESNVQAFSQTTASAVGAGATVIPLISIDGFEVGDSIYIIGAPTGPIDSQTISAIAPGPKTLTLSSALAHAFPQGSTVGHHGGNEVDLVPLRVSKPTTLAPGVNTMTLYIPAGVTLWENTWKGIAVPMDGPGVKNFDVTTMPASVLYWAELASPSLNMRDISLTLTYADVRDDVRATSIWATVESEHATRTLAEIQADIAWNDFGDNVENALTKFGGTGLRPIVGGNPDYGVANVILIKFRVTPAGQPDDPNVPGDQEIPGIQDEPDVGFDIGRGEDYGATVWAGTQNASNRFYFPAKWDEANDDSVETDEDAHPNEHSGNFYSFDAPGLETSYHQIATQYMIHFNFKEFVRVSFNGTPPSGTAIQGSRMSPFFEWHATQKLNRSSAAGLWKRTTGNNPSAVNDPEVNGVNDVGAGHIPFGDPPYN